MCGTRVTVHLARLTIEFLRLPLYVWIPPSFNAPQHPTTPPPHPHPHHSSHHNPANEPLRPPPPLRRGGGLLLGHILSLPTPSTPSSPPSSHPPRPLLRLRSPPRLRRDQDFLLVLRRRRRVQEYDHDLIVIGCGSGGALRGWDATHAESVFTG